MRNILIIALCFIAFSVEAQDSLMTSKGVKRDTTSLLSAYKSAIQTNITNIGTNTTSITTKIDKQGVLGTIYNKNTWVDVSDFVSTTTTAIVGGKIRLTGGAGTYTQTIALTQPSMLEYWKITAKIKIETITATSYAIGIGMLSTNNYGANSVLGRCGWITTPNPVALLDNQTGGAAFANIATNSTTTPASVNDYVLMTIERVKDSIFYTVRNITQNTAEVTARYGYTFVSPYIHNTGRFAIYNFGGQYLLDSLAVVSKEVVNPTLMIIGNSKTQGFDASGWSTPFSQLLKSDYSTVVHAGGFDQTIEMLTTLPEVASIAPKQVILFDLMSNDQRHNTFTDSTNYYTRYDSIVHYLTNRGIIVYHASTYESSINLSAQKAYIARKYPAANIIDTWTPLTIPNALSAGGVHPNDFGHFKIYSTILESNLISGRFKQSGVNSASATSSSISGLTNSTFTIASGTNNVSNSLFTQDATTGSMYGSNTYNGTFDLGVLNPSTGTAAATRLLLGINNTTDYFAFSFTGASYATNGIISQKAASLFNAGTGGMNFINNASAPIKFAVGGFTSTKVKMMADITGVRIGDDTSPTALLHIKAGTAAASTAPLKFTSGTNLTFPEDGAVEYNGTNFFGTSGATRYTFQKTLFGGISANVGTATLVAGTVTVSTTVALTASLIYVTVKTAGGTQGFLSVPTITNATSFVINSTSATEASTVNWWIIN